jgi:hypothetical protein
MADDVESLEDFRQRARIWIKENVPPAVPGQGGAMIRNGTEEEELADVQRTRDLQRQLFDGGFAGLAVPTAYGGQGLTPAHQVVWNEEIVGYQYPERNQVPTFTPCMAILLEFASEELKREHIPKMLSGEEIWMQLLSEPSGGSDVAGAQTTAVRDGDEWVINGSKIWTTGAWWSDWGLALIRTNPEVPKHRGLSVFCFKLHQPGIEVHQIEMLNGAKEFCQEFITDLRVPDGARVGDVDDGWTIGIRWMYHERTVAGGSPYVTAPAGSSHRGGPSSLVPYAKQLGVLQDAHARQLVGESYVLSCVGPELIKRLSGLIARGKITDQAAAIGRLHGGMSSVRQATIQYELGGVTGAAWEDADDNIGTAAINYLQRQAGCLGGGSTEMARNVISERVLGMPRERTMDKDIPFRDVPKGPPAR